VITVVPGGAVVNRPMPGADGLAAPEPRAVRVQGAAEVAIAEPGVVSAPVPFDAPSTGDVSGAIVGQPGAVAVDAPTGLETAPGEVPADATGENVEQRGQGWAPPVEVAALYYPREPLDGDAVALDAQADGDRESTVGSGAADSGPETAEQLDRPAVSCADPSTGVTLAMPVIVDDDDERDAQSPSSASHVANPADLAAIEEGIRAKSAGNIDGALAAWKPVASRGNATAQYLVGLLYVTGEANPSNLRTAYAWLSLAAAQGHQLSACEMLRLEQRLLPEDVTLARQQAVEMAESR
jgi:hypothetical protein